MILLKDKSMISNYFMIPATLQLILSKLCFVIRENTMIKLNFHAKLSIILKNKVFYKDCHTDCETCFSFSSDSCLSCS